MHHELILTISRSSQEYHLIPPDNYTIVALFPWQKQKDFFSETEKERMVEAIRAAEQRTSGEVRVYVESKCKYVNALDRAEEMFRELKMDATEQRNGVLVYVAIKDKQVAVYGDEGIHRAVGAKYWSDVLAKMLLFFKNEHLSEGIYQCVTEIGEALHFYFPYNQETDKNELPDEIVFGK